MRMHNAIKVALALTITLSSSIASADAIMGPPTDCPPGAAGVSSHSGAWCEVTSCTSDADCTASRWDKKELVCASASLCVREEKYVRSSRVYRPDAAPNFVTRRVAQKTCSAGGACDESEAKCETAMRCVPKSAATPPAPTVSAVTTPPPRADAGSVTVTDVPAVDKKGSSCGCAATTSQDAGGLAVLVAAVVGALVTRRRSR